MLGDLFIALLLGILLLLLSPIIVPLIIYTYIRDWIGERRFESFLKANEDAKFFCYTARKTSCKYVSENIVPCLPADTKIIYLDDRKNEIVSLGDTLPFVHHLAWRMKKTAGSYPYVSKVVEGELVTISVNRQLYSAIRRSADAEVINKKIRRFLIGGPETTNISPEKSETMVSSRGTNT